MAVNQFPAALEKRGHSATPRRRPLRAFAGQLAAALPRAWQPPFPERSRGPSADANPQDHRTELAPAHLTHATAPPLICAPA